MDKEAKILSIAARQGGWVTRVQALDAGFSSAAIGRRVESGRWVSARSAYRLIEMTQTDQLVRAACAVLPGAVVSHHSAARLRGLRPVADDLAVVTVPSRTTHVFPDVEVRRNDDLAPQDVSVLDGDLPVTNPARTIADLAADCSIAHLALILRNAEVDGITTRESVREVFERIGRRGKPGTRTLRSVLGVDAATGRPSPLEEAGMRALADAGLDGFHTEYPIPWSPHRRFDVAIPAARVAIEWDSLAWHSDPDSFEADRRRDREAAARGWTVLRFTWNDVETDPGRVGREVHRLLESRRRRELELADGAVVR